MHGRQAGDAATAAPPYAEGGAWAMAGRLRETDEVADLVALGRRQGFVTSEDVDEALEALALESRLQGALQARLERKRLQGLVDVLAGHEALSASEGDQVGDLVGLAQPARHRPGPALGVRRCRGGGVPRLTSVHLRLPPLQKVSASPLELE